MFQGVLDAVTHLIGPIDEVRYSDLLRQCARFATTLQVNESSWPADRAAFERYWSASIHDVHMDDVTRAYLRGLASLEFLPAPLARLVGPSHRFLTIGFLPTPFREELGLAWSPQQQRRFEKVVAGLALVNRHLPTALREFPWNLVEWDTRRRIARGRSVL
jgi:uncharacterized protein (DUF2236 family)